MLKKIALVVMLILPMGVIAQTLKFGHIASREVMVLMPEYTKAMSEMQALEKQFTDEMQVLNEEFNKKFQEYQAAMSEGTLPQNIQERRLKDLQDLQERSESFQQDAYQQMQKASQEKMVPIGQKLEGAIKEVGQAEGFIYIFDLSNTAIPFVNESQSIDVTAKVKAKLGI